MISETSFFKKLYQLLHHRISSSISSVLSTFTVPVPLPVEMLSLPAINSLTEKTIIKMMSWLLVLAVGINYIVVPYKPTAYEKLIFSMVCMILIGKIWILIDYLELSIIKKFILAEHIALYLICAFLHPLSAVFINSLLLLGSAFISSENIPRLTLTAIVCAFANSFAMSKSLWSETTITFILLYCFPCCAFAIRTYNDNMLFAQLSSELIKCHETIQSKSMFVASVSHDLKNPLNAILSSIEVLKSSQSIAPSEKKSLSIAGYSGQIMLFLINSVIDATKIGTGKFDLTITPLSIIEETKKVLRIQKELAKQKSISIYRRVFTPIPPFVMGDAMRLAQTIINLVGNAIKFTSQGYVAVLLRWAKNEEEAKENFLGKLFKSRLIDSETDLIIPPEEYFIMGSKASASPKTHCPRHSSLGKCGNLSDGMSMAVMEASPLGGDPNEELIISSDYNTESKPPGPKVSMQIPAALLRELIPRRLSRTHPIILTSSEHIIQIDTIQRLEAPSSMSLVPEQSSFMEDIPNSIDKAEPETDFPEAKGYFVFDVVDTGIGLTPEEENRLFKPFSQAHENIKKSYGGTGLGLWITKQLVELMKGEIKVRSKKNRGTIFTVVLPFPVCKEEPAKMNPIKRISMGPIKSNRLPNGKERVNPASRDMSALRVRGKVEASKGSDNAINPKVLILENLMYEDDNKLEQVASQVKKRNCSIIYAAYDSAIEKIKQENFDISAVVIISSAQVSATKTVYSKIFQLEMPENKPPLHIIIASTLSFQNELSELAGQFIVTFPMKQDTLANMLFRILKPKSRDNTGTFEEIKHKSLMSESSQECTAERRSVLLADDDVLSNLAVKTMIEKEGKYQVASVFNGREVIVAVC